MPATLTVAKLFGVVLALTDFGFQFLLWIQGEGALKRVWAYLNQKFRVGNIEVSATSLVLGLIVFLTAIVLARFVSSLLQRRFAARANLDPGIRYTIARLANYVLITIGLLAALKQAFGLDLTSIAVVFTALSVGIGFGLQYLAADIASGFILLFERPIRVGDRISIGEDEGDVQSIRLRTTIVYTNNRIAIIVPNSKLVSQSVINWSYGDARARISIPVGVATNSDIDVVKETLIAAADGVERVLDNPPPNVQFLKFGDYSLDFRLLVWTREPNRHPQIRSDINYRIAKLFRTRGIKLGQPVSELRLSRPGLASDSAASLLDEERAIEAEATPEDG
ncbi:MAG: mechanosensitive ion channel [Pyrinomonadaceae bacterium]|nr:mechanosensitive ion channel [Pyrinomonadaceae bacterium]